MTRVTLFAAAMIVACGTATAVAQHPVLAELYGRGVHQYFSGNYIEAHQHFSTAIDNGSRDPRVYYFRGLVHSMTGREEEAQADWQTGAQLEARGDFAGTISRSLARIQGAQRMELESIRQLARLQNQSEQRARAQARYRALGEAEGEVLRDPGRAATPRLPAAPPEDLPANPFDEAGRTEAGEPTIQAEDALPDPLADADEAPGAPARPAEPAAPGDPFDLPADDTDPFGDAFGAPPADDGDPFGAQPFDAAPAAPPADEGDPFDMAPAAPPADEDDPFADLLDTPPADEPDPFDAPAPPAEPLDPPPADAPAAGEDDPFDAPAPPVDEDDPFGDDPADASADDEGDPFDDE